MIVTSHAVKYLINGAEAYNNDINAIDGNGVQFDAGQICTKDWPGNASTFFVKWVQTSVGGMRTTNVARYLLQVSYTYNKGLGRRIHNVVEIVLQKISFSQ
jgi:hypothetical protein